MADLTDREPVKCLHEFIEKVQKLRRDWQVPAYKELWFRGESKRYDTWLRPNLYRPVNGRLLKPIYTLLHIEHELYDRFTQIGVQLTDERPHNDDANWDWYFLMQHHRAPNRLLDWTDGALMALHFAVQNTKYYPSENCGDTTERSETEKDKQNPRVYALEPTRMNEHLIAFPETVQAKSQWKEYLRNHHELQYDGLTDEHWEEVYLPSDDDERAKLPVPRIPLLLDFDRISRRIAAQRSQFMVFGTDPNWLADEFNKPDAPIKEIVIDVRFVGSLRTELRDCGITESVIFPDLDGLGRELNQLFEDWE